MIVPQNQFLNHIMYNSELIFVRSALLFLKSRHNLLTFVFIVCQVTESFLGDDPTVQSFHQLVDFIKDGYVETEEEKMERLMKVRGHL